MSRRAACSVGVGSESPSALAVSNSPSRSSDMIVVIIMPRAELTTRQVRDLLEDLARPDARGKVRTAATLSRIRSLLSGALQDALADELVTSNVARGVRLPEAAASSRDAHAVFTPSQLAAFLADIDGTPFGAVVRFVAATGVRRGEAVGLLWDAVDLDERAATIGRSLTKVAGRIVIDKPKTKKGERVVPLNVETVAMLRDLRKAHAEERLRSGALWNPEGFVFVRADGSHLLPDRCQPGGQADHHGDGPARAAPAQSAPLLRHRCPGGGGRRQGG